MIPLLIHAAAKTANIDLSFASPRSSEERVVHEDGLRCAIVSSWIRAMEKALVVCSVPLRAELYHWMGLFFWRGRFQENWSGPSPQLLSWLKDAKVSQGITSPSPRDGQTHHLLEDNFFSCLTFTIFADALDHASRSRVSPASHQQGRILF